MAKKKRTTKKSSPRAKKKSVSKKRSTKSKKTAGKGSPKKSTPGRGNSSVDSLLKKFAKERTQKESQLESLRKNKLEMENKARKFQEQIAKLAHQEKETQSHIAQLDKQRDEEVSQLLAKLGIQLGGGSVSNPPVVPAPSRDQNAKHTGDRMKHPRERGAVQTPNGRNENH